MQLEKSWCVGRTSDILPLIDYQLKTKHILQNHNFKKICSFSIDKKYFLHFSIFPSRPDRLIFKIGVNVFYKLIDIYFYTTFYYIAYMQFLNMHLLYTSSTIVVIFSWGCSRGWLKGWLADELDIALFQTWLLLRYSLSSG